VTDDDQAVEPRIPPVAPTLALRPRRSRAWSVGFRVMYRFLRLLDPLIRSWIANGFPGLGGVVELRFAGARTGTAKRVLVTLLNSGGRWYVGHPNGTATWIRSIEAAGKVDVEPPSAHGSSFRVSRVPAGTERDAVIRATATQQPFPANVLYRLAQRHIAAVGVYLRLEPSSPRLETASLVAPISHPAV
jgi:hypothetical protein